MNFKTTAVLLALVLVGGAIWLFAPAPAPQDDAAKDTTPTRPTQYVFDPRPERDAIQSLTFEIPGKLKLAFERGDDPSRPGTKEWRMTEPIASRTESYMVDGLATTLSGLTSQRIVTLGAAGGVSAADAGLAPPQAILTVTDKDGKTYALEIGKRVALSNDTYVRVVGQTDAHVVSRGFDTELKRTAKDFRAKGLFRLNVPDVRQVTLDHAGKHYELNKAEGDKWVIDAPVKSHGDAMKIKKLLTDFANVRVQEFVEDAPQSLAPFGLTQPHLALHLTAESRREIKPEPPAASQPTTDSAPAEPQFETITTRYSLLVGDFADMEKKLRFIKLADEPWVATAPEDALAKLEPKLTEWRDPVVARIHAADVTRIDLVQGPQGITLERGESGWTSNQPGAAIDDEAVRQLLTALEDARALDYIDAPESPATYGFEPPRAVLNVTTRGAVAPVVLEVGGATPSGRNTFVRLGGQPGILVLSETQASKLAVSPLSLRSRTITDFDAGELRQIRVVRGDRAYDLRRALEGGILQDWRMDEPQAAPPDAAAIRELSNTIARLRAKTLADEGNFAAYGLDSPLATIEFTHEPAPAASQPASQPTSEPATAVEETAPPAPVAHVLRIGRASDRTYCRLDDQPLVYELDSTHLPVFTAELIRRKLFDFKADALRGIRIAAPGGNLEFAREDDRWVFAPEPVVALSQTKMKELAEALAGLMVDAYVAYAGGDLEAHGLAAAPVTVTLNAAGEAGQMQTITLRIDQVAQGELPRKAAWVEQGRVFLLRQADIERLMRGLDAYVKLEGEKDEPETPALPSP